MKKNHSSKTKRRKFKRQEAIEEGRKLLNKKQIKIEKP